MMALSGDVDYGALAALGIECSTYVSINRGTSGRDALFPYGNTAHKSVRDANTATSRQGIEHV